MAPWLRALLHRDPNHNAALRICAAWHPRYPFSTPTTAFRAVQTPESDITFAPSTRRRLNADVLPVLRTTGLLDSHQAPITISPNTRTSSNITALPTAPVNEAEKLLVVARDVVKRPAPRRAINVSRSGRPSSNTAPASLVVATDHHQDDVQLKDENNKGSSQSICARIVAFLKSLIVAE
ncbi:hypothetical protein BDZ89DRAFT_1140765 [Hymenopellis radicata]|nr:hypothetical protein BDZ89DRAFT_1140765 [Hymenopellis radicata]